MNETLKKYELTEETLSHGGHTLHRIRALRDFPNVQAGDLGGWIEREENLSHDGDAWVYGTAEVCGNARVYGNATVHGNAQVYGDAWVYGNASVGDNARVFSNAQVCAYARVCGNARVYGDAYIHGYIVLRAEEVRKRNDIVSVCCSQYYHINATPTHFRIGCVTLTWADYIEQFDSLLVRHGASEDEAAFYRLAFDMCKKHFKIGETK
jgi:NDP-sugar pyrophosphorylase family protein